MIATDSVFTDTGRHPFKHVGLDGWLKELPLLRRRELWLPCAQLSIPRYLPQDIPGVGASPDTSAMEENHVYWALHVIKGYLT